MTTANKVPANWQAGLKMADAIAGIVKEALANQRQSPSPLDTAIAHALALRRILKLVGGGEDVVSSP